MKAMVCTRYGPADVLQLQDVEKPQTKDHEILVRIHATSVTAADYRIRGLNVPFGFGVLMRLALGFHKPRNAVLGLNFSGVVEAIGRRVKRFEIGERVFGTTGMKFGAYAEYLAVSETSTVLPIPDNVTFSQAAAFPFGALTALYFLRDKAHIKQGQKVLVYGASGSVGTAAVQLAHYFGAEVTGVCSTANVALVKSIGAKYVIDYTKEDCLIPDDTFNIVFDTVGKAPFLDTYKKLRPDGKYLLAVASLPMQCALFFVSLFNSKKIFSGVSGESLDDLAFLTELLASGSMTPVIDTEYVFEDLPLAHAYAEKGHKKGSVVIRLQN